MSKLTPIKAFASIAIILLSIAISSCSKSDAETAYEAQEKRISTYVENVMSNDTTGITVSYKDGSTILTLSQGEGEGLSENGTLTFEYIGYQFTGTTLSNSNIFATSSYEVAESAGLGVSDSTIYKPVTASLKDTDFITGLKNGLIGAKKDEVRIILFSGKYGFGKKQLGTIYANSALAYYILIDEVKN